jgi:hypothetical protein
MPVRLRPTLLCEDRAQERLLRPVLERFGRNKVRVVIAKDRALGAGVAWVLAQVPDEARVLRQRHQESVGLFIAIDGDAEGAVGRRRQVDDALAQAGAPRLSEDEKIAVLVPCRAIETWLLWLSGRRDLDEEQPFKHAWERELAACRVSFEAAARVFAEGPSTDEGQVLPALAQARTDLARVRALTGRD